MSTTPKTFVPLSVFRDINRKKALYGRYADLKQWDKFDEVALPDCQFLFLDQQKQPLYINKTALAFSSTNDFTSFFEKLFAKAQTLHMFGPGDLTRVSDQDLDEVHAVWALEDQLLFSPLGEIRGGGYYYETWRRVDGDWFLADLRMERTYQKIDWAVWVALMVDKWLGISLM